MVPIKQAKKSAAQPPDETEERARLHKLRQVEDYEMLVGAQVVDRILNKSKPLRGMHVVNINSTYYGGGVAELLSSMTLLMNGLGVETGWRNLHGRPDFFAVTKKMHNALQGDSIHLTQRKKQIYEEVLYENSVLMHINHDYVVIHDPQPLGIIRHYPKKCPWVWRCHIDLSRPNKALWKYLAPFVERYDAVLVSNPEYQQTITPPQRIFMPAIDPFTIKNRPLSEYEVNERLRHYNIPTDLPIIAQISRFDRWKDPEGVIRAFRKARKEVDCTLVLLGNGATDDPEGQQVLESLLGSQDERTLILSCGDDTALVNALQTKADVILQKSIREGFGLTVTEAMWKGTPVIGGNVGGIQLQIQDGVNGFLVSSEEEAAERIVQLLKNKSLRETMGQKAKDSVRKQFLLTRLLEQYVDLFCSFEPVFQLR